ncbi:unnamed protein product, partial [marine sediment metagenome]
MAMTSVLAEIATPLTLLAITDKQLLGSIVTIKC